MSVCYCRVFIRHLIMFWLTTNEVEMVRFDVNVSVASSTWLPGACCKCYCNCQYQWQCLFFFFCISECVVPYGTFMCALCLQGTWPVTFVYKYQCAPRGYWLEWYIMLLLGCHWFLIGQDTHQVRTRWQDILHCYRLRGYGFNMYNYI